LGRRLLDRI